MVDQLRILARDDHRPDKDGGYPVALAPIVLVECHDEETIVGHGPLHVSVQVQLEPAIALLNRAVVHIIVEVGYHEREGRKGGIVGWKVTVR